MTKEENVIPTWKQKLLCTGCAAVLAAGLIPMAAWGGATEGSGDVTPAPQALEAENDAGVTTANETGTSDNTQTPGTDTPTGGDQNGDGDGQGDGDGENSGDGKDAGTPTEGNNQNQPDNTGEDNDQNDPTDTDNEGTNQDDGDGNTGNEGDDTETGDQGVTYADVKVTSGDEMSMHVGEEATLTSPDGVPFSFNSAAHEFFSANSFESYIVSATSSDPSVVSATRDNESEYFGSAYWLEAKKPGTATITLTLKDKAPVSCKITVTADDADQEVTYADVEVTSAGTMSMWPGDGVPLESPDMGPFVFNGAAREFFDTNSYTDYFESVVSSDPSVIAITHENEEEWYNAYFLEAKKPGTATVTLTLKDKEPVSCKITVKSAADADLSKLKFQTKNITMKVGESNYTGWYGAAWLGEEAEEAVGYNYAFASSDDSILDCWVNNGSYIAALRPGVVTIGLYYFNPETEEYTQTDTATVTITSPSVLAGSTSSSDISGNIIASNEDLDTLVTDNGVKLDVKIKSENDLTAAQKKGLILVKDATEADRAIPIDISLIDREGDVIHGGEEGYTFPYTVRIKLEGQLAELDPATIQVFYLADDGIPENITSWVEDGYLYIVTDHFSQYVVTGDLKADSATQTAGNKVDANKVTASKKQTVTATAGETLPQAGDESTAVVPVVALSAAAAAAAIYLARRRMQE